MERYYGRNAEQFHSLGGSARAHREVAADWQEGDVRAMQLADERHIPEHVRVSCEVDAPSVLQLEHEPDRLAQVERHLLVRSPVPGGMVGVDHSDPDAPGGDGATLVHPDDLGRGVEVTQPQAHLVDAGPDRGRARGDGDRVGPIHCADRSAQVVEVAVAD